MAAFTPLSSPIKQQLLTQHYQQSEQAVFILDADRRYLSTNAAYEKLTGYSEDTLMGQCFGAFASRFLTQYESKILEKLNAKLDANDIYQESFTLPNRDGSTINYSIVFQKFTAEAKHYFIGFINQISYKTIAPAVNSPSNAYVLDSTSKHSTSKQSALKDSTLNESSADNDVDNISPEPLDGLSLKNIVLSEAISNNQFEAYYQPKYRLDSKTVIGFEALVRWQHPTRGLLFPKDFIDEIVRYQLSFALFCKLSEQVAQLLVKWQDMGFDQHICVNADAAEFSHPDFNKTISQLLTKYNLASYSLHIEMTESSLVPSGKDIKQRLMELKASKTCLALDDFGTGYSSLSYLQDYPFDFIKIDKSFIANLTSNSTQQAIVKAILDLAKALDMQVIAEGIETEQQYDKLREMGCLYGQGYWLGRPISAARATQLLIDTDSDSKPY